MLAWTEGLTVRGRPVRGDGQDGVDLLGRLDRTVYLTEMQLTDVRDPQGVVTAKFGAITTGSKSPSMFAWLSPAQVSDIYFVLEAVSLGGWGMIGH